MIREFFERVRASYKERVREASFSQGYKYADKVLSECKGDRQVARELWAEATGATEGWEQAFDSGVHTRLRRLQLTGN